MDINKSLHYLKVIIQSIVAKFRISNILSSKQTIKRRDLLMLPEVRDLNAGS
jgi:hypothetical protein